MQVRSKKILMTSAAALTAVMLPTGCAIEILPGIIGGATTGGGAVGGGAVGGATGAIPVVTLP